MDSYKVLIVDDERNQLDLLNEVLSNAQANISVIATNNGTDALDILRRETVDAVLLDKRMPYIDGVTLCRMIRTEPKHQFLPIIIVTGSTGSEELQRCFEVGATDVVHKPYSPIELLARVKTAIKSKRLTDQLDSAETLLFTLARMVEAKDETTGNHCTRLVHMCTVFGNALGLDNNDIATLQRGGILHDIGKLGIPDSILMKQGPLTEAEWAVMKTHTLIGGHLCEGLASMRDVMPIIVHHHERWDGSGYPHRLAGNDIPFLARVFQILDIYDALSTPRPYKQALNLKQIIDVMIKETTQGWREPDLMNSFLQILRTRPESLHPQSNPVSSHDEQIFQRISSTGAINWDQRKTAGSNS